MSTKTGMIILATLLAVFVTGCSDDSVRPQVKAYNDLTLRDHVLLNLERAYNEKNSVQVEKLLDGDFVFHFSQADVKNGNVTVEQWDRASELVATANLFDPNLSKPGVDPVSKIDLTLRYTEGEDEWDEVPSDGRQAYPGEVWYEKTVRYDLIVTSGPIDYTGLNIQASFTVRMAEVGGEIIWQVVKWRDDTENSLGAVSGSNDAAPVGTEPKTWGVVKALYAERFVYRDLTKRDHVLMNLENAYNERNLNRVTELLDNDFIFHFSEADYRNGQVGVEQWDRASEFGATRNLFDPTYEGPYGYPADGIYLRLAYGAGEDLWTAVVPHDQKKYPGETWYEKIVRYDLIVSVGPIDYIGFNIPASFVVRWGDVGGSSKWRIISWRDDTYGQLAALLTDAGVLGGAAEKTTWGVVKYYFSD